MNISVYIYIYIYYIYIYIFHNLTSITFFSVFEKTYEYVERFNHFPNNKAGNEAVMLIREYVYILNTNAKTINYTLPSNMRQTLTEFESASLVSLCPQSKEEAKALIPDLAKYCINTINISRYDDDILEDFIEYLNNQTNTH